MNNDFLSNLNWRSAIKEFDQNKKVSDEDLAKILNAIRMAPSSNGFQPYHIYVVADQKLKDRLREDGGGQAQLSECSYLLVFASKVDLARRVEEYVNLMTGGNAESEAKLAEFKESRIANVKKKTKEEAKAWADRQTYIALGFALAACAELKIDSCPMEGFDPEVFDRILSLPKDIKSVVLLAVGYRKADPTRSKIRFPESDLFTKF